MVNRHKGMESGSAGSGSYKDADQIYCVVLHVVEAINFVGRDASERDREKIVMNAVLNTVQFEVEGTQSSTAETIIFNSNCIWESDMPGIKRLKTDHRPVKITFNACRRSGRTTIGTVLLPVRGLPVVSSPGSHNAPQLKMFWHKLICISSEFRSHKPEVLLMLAIIKKSILHNKDFDHLMQFVDNKSPPTSPLKSAGHSMTSSMLQSQANVYVQSLVQLGLLQVGNDPLIDCDIIEVVLQLKQLKNVNRLVQSQNAGKDTNSVVLVFDFVGNVTSIELKLNESDSYTLNDVLGIRFKTSLKSMRLYFQRIFYLPINMYMNGTAIANYRMDFGDLLPPDSYFSENRKYTCNGSFSFNRFGRMNSAREPKPPSMEYAFSVDMMTVMSRQDWEPAPSTRREVFRELPEDRKECEVSSLSHDTASVGSLNVGTELSASDRSCGSISLPEAGHDSDAPVELLNTTSSSKKFTRLTDGDTFHTESEDGRELGKKFSALVVRESFSSEKQEEEFIAKEHKKIEFLLDDSDVEIAQFNENRKSQNKILKSKDQLQVEIREERKLKVKSMSKKRSALELSLASPRKQIINSQGSKELLRETSKTRTSAPLRRKSSVDDNPLRESPKTRVKVLPPKEKAALEEKRLETPIKECFKTRVNVPKTSLEENKCKIAIEGSSKTEARTPVRAKPSVNNKDVKNPMRGSPKPRFKSPTKGHPILDDKECEELTSLEQFEREEKKLESEAAFASSMKRKIESDIREGSPVPIERKVRKPKQGDKDRHTELQNSSLNVTFDGPSASSSNESYPENVVCKKIAKRLSKREHSEVDVPPEKLIRSRNDIQIKKNRESTTEDSFEQSVEFEIVQPSKKTSSRKKKGRIAKTSREIRKPENSDLETDSQDMDLVQQKRNTKFKQKLPKDLEHFEEIKKTKPFHSDLSLRARWVEVNKVQEKARIETEKFLEENCQVELNSVLYEDQLTLGLSKPLKMKKKSKEQKVIDLDSSYVEERSSPRDPLKEKKRTLPVEEHVLRMKLKSCEEYVSLTDVTSKSAEVIQERVVKKKKLRRVIKDRETGGHLESLQEQVKPVKKKIIKKKSLLVLDNENTDLSEEHFQEQAKKIVKKKPKPNEEQPPEEDSVSTKTISSKKFLTDNTTRKDFKDLEVPDVDQLSKTDSVYQWLLSWRRQQIRIFEEELASKESHYKSQLEKMEHQETRKLIQKEEALQKIPPIDYEAKFNELEQHIARLKTEMEQQVRLFESRSLELRQENQNLSSEKTELKARIAAMEQQIGQLRLQGSDEGDLKKVLEELRSQNRRYLDLAREKDRYKKQLRRCVRRVHALKMAMYERNVDRARDGMEVSAIDLKQILTKDAMDFEREYGQFRHKVVSPRFPLSGMSGSSDFSSLTGNRMSNG
ncbi:hypothetical protein KR009_005312 [Drosophila setifemur]|nr:hypothetical protein KR009_005312 [Drosophila setifemur]